MPTNAVSESLGKFWGLASAEEREKQTAAGNEERHSYEQSRMRKTSETQTSRHGKADKRGEEACMCTHHRVLVNKAFCERYTGCVSSAYCILV